MQSSEHSCAGAADRLMADNAMTENPMAGAATGVVGIVLRLEGLAVLIGAGVAYAKAGMDGKMFAMYFLAPDLSLLAYLAGKRYGAIAYNLAHCYVGALACVAAGALWPTPTLLAAGLIWCAHIGFDRALGYGLKYAVGFGWTHLGPVGPAARSLGAVRNAATRAALPRDEQRS